MYSEFNQIELRLIVLIDIESYWINSVNNKTIACRSIKC